MLHFDILTLFPEMFGQVFDHSIIRRARDRGMVSIRLHNIRDYARDKHRLTDDTPYGGGGGMVLKPEPIFNAVETILGLQVPPDGYKADPAAGRPRIILLSPQGRTFTQALAQTLSTESHLVLLCARYEGVDERVRQLLISEQISIGDYVLSGGEIPAMVLVDTLVRLQPGLLGDPDATADDSHATGLLEYPHYTRPPEFRGYGIPEVLLSGNHAAIDAWRRQQALQRTLQQRPDLLTRAALTPQDQTFLQTLTPAKTDENHPDEPNHVPPIQN